MRLPLATDLKTRTGAPDKDARLKNCYVESKGPMNDPNNPPQTAVRKRPIAQGGIAVGTGTAQGGIGLNVNGVPYFFGFWSDVLYPYFSTGTTWNSGTAYNVGDMVSVNFKDYWAKVANTNSLPPNSNWNDSYVPAVPPVSGWTSGTVPFPPYIGNHPIAWNGSIYVFIGNNPSTGLAAPCTSTDGLIWTQQPDIAGLSYGVTGLYSINWNGAQFIAVGAAGVGQFYWAISSNGISWTVHIDATGIPDLYDIAWNGSVYCAVGNAAVYTSTNGLTWTNQSNPGGNYRAIEWNGTVFVIAGRLSNAAATSTSGVTWTPTTLPANTSWERIKSKAGTICITAGGTQSNFATSSNNGTSWTGGVTGVLGGDGLTSNSSLFLVTTSGVSTSNYATSSDGLNWTSRTLPSTKIWESSGYGNKFVVIDSTTICATSTTGT